MIAFKLQAFRSGFSSHRLSTVSPCTSDAESGYAPTGPRSFHFGQPEAGRGSRYRPESGHAEEEHKLGNQASRATSCRNTGFRTTQGNMYLFVDEVVECLGSSWNFDIMRQIEVLHVVRTIGVFSHESLSSRSKSLNGILFTFLHLLISMRLDTRHSFSSMNLVSIDRMPIQVPDCLDRVSPPLDLHLIGLHSLLNLGTNLPQSSINTGLSDTRIRCILDSRQKIVIYRVEGNREGGIDYPAFDVGSEIDLADIVVTDDCVVSRIGSVVSRHVIEGTTCRKSYSGVQIFFWCQFSVVVLKSLAYISQPLSRFYDALGKPPHLPLNIRSFPEVLNCLVKGSLLQFELLVLDTRDLVLVDLVSSVAHKLIIREFMLRRSVPTSQAAKDLIGLGIGMDIVEVVPYFFGSLLLFCVDWGLLSRFLLLLVLLFFLFLLLALFSVTLFGLLLLIIGRLLRLLLLLFGQQLSLLLNLLLLSSQLHLLLLKNQ